MGKNYLILVCVIYVYFEAMNFLCTNLAINGLLVCCFIKCLFIGILCHLTNQYQNYLTDTSRKDCLQNNVHSSNLLFVSTMDNASQIRNDVSLWLCAGVSRVVFPDSTPVLPFLFCVNENNKQATNFQGGTRKYLMHVR